MSASRHPSSWSISAGQRRRPRSGSAADSGRASGRLVDGGATVPGVQPYIAEGQAGPPATGGFVTRHLCCTPAHMMIGDYGSPLQACRRSFHRIQASTFDLAFMTIQAAIDGIGVAMGQTAYVADDIAKGRLVVPSTSPCQPTRAFISLHHRARQRHRKSTHSATGSSPPLRKL